MRAKKPKVSKYIRDEVLKELITENQKDCVIQKAEDIYRDKEKCMAILAKHQLDEQINYRRPVLDSTANAHLTMSAAYLDISVRVDRGIVTVTLENLFKRHHAARTIYEGKWEDI